jgi:hypothetical protein
MPLMRSIPRFRLENTGLVEQGLRRLFATNAARRLVSSAACGADLLALTVAGTLGMRRRVILPFDRIRFRRTSVTDRPGDWGPVYNRVLTELDATQDVVTLERHRSETAAYAAANHTIRDEAAGLVWDGVPRDDEDLTATFGREARGRNLRVDDVWRCPSRSQ